MYRIRLSEYLLLWSLSILAYLTSSGCSSMTGFGSLSDGPATTGELRKAAHVSRAEADAFERMADEQDAELRRTLSTAADLATTLGAPEVVTGLIAGLGGLLLPSPIKRKKKPTE